VRCKLVKSKERDMTDSLDRMNQAMEAESKALRELLEGMQALNEKHTDLINMQRNKTIFESLRDSSSILSQMLQSIMDRHDKHST